ncbi:MAG: glycoside hydrolase family 5 protein [Pseudomonadota bacterium]
MASGLLALASAVVRADSFDTRRCINMGNALDAPEEGEWGHTIEAESFRRIAQAGFDTVRIPVRWSAHTGDAPRHQIAPRFFNRVTQVIEQALANDLQVILNVHHFDELNKDPQANREKLLALWRQIGERYKDLPPSVYFEVINEPNGAFKGDVMRAIVTEAFHEIRKSNPDRILIMGGDQWSGLKSLASIPRIDDPNQVYTFHYYDPFAFTHQKAGWTDLKDSDVVSWGSDGDRAALASDADYARRVREQVGVPVFLGEVGAYEQAPYDDVVAYTAQTRKAFDAVGIPWCVWSFTATFPFFDQQAQQWDVRKLAALGLTKDADDQHGARLLPPPAATTQRSTEQLTLDDAYNALRRDIGRDGSLLMVPYPDQLAHYGAMRVKRQSDDAVPGGTAVEVKVARAAPNPWDAGFSGPLALAVSKGDTLVMAFWARSVRGDNAIISNAGLQLNAAPYDPLAPLQPAPLTSDWQRFVVSAVADRNYAAGELGYTLQVAGAKQVIRIGPVFVMNTGQVD